MPPTGFHGLIGLIIASRIPISHENARVAIFFGSLFPDLDIFGSMLIGIVGIIQGIPLNDLHNPVINFHRSVTHNIFLILFLLILGSGLFFIKKEKYREIGIIITSFGIGIGIHVLLDFFYFDGVSIFWPIISSRQYLPLGLPILQNLPDNIQRFYLAADISFDGIYWILFARLLRRSQIKSINVKKIKYEKFLTLGGALTLVGFILLALFGLFTNFLSLNLYAVIIYIPGGLVLFISCSIPIYYRDVVKKLPVLPQAWYKNQII